MGKHLSLLLTLLSLYFPKFERVRTTTRKNTKKYIVGGKMVDPNVEHTS